MGLGDLPHWKFYISKLKLQSKVLSNKKYLLNDPVVQGMNDTQWLFEFESYSQSQEARYEEYRIVLDAWKSMLTGLLGLNLMPVEEEEGGRLRMPTQDEIMPLSLIVGREEVVSTISKRLEEFRNQSEVDEQLGYEEPEDIESTADDLPDAIFPTDGEDLRKFLIQNSEVTKRTTEAWVLPLDQKDEGMVNSIKEDRKPKKSRLRID